eukprot:gene47505-biopygen35403
MLIEGNCTVVTTIADDITEFSNTHRALQTLNCSADE